MRPKHHLDIATLMTCAAGSQPEVLAAVISSHLSVCPHCRTELTGLTRVGAVLFDALSPVEFSGNVPDAMRAPDKFDRRTGISGDGTAPPIMASVTGRLDRLDWHDAGAGVRSAALPLSSGAHGSLCIVHLDPGTRLPNELHRSRDLTFVISGRYFSGADEFEAGDIDDPLAPSDEPPIADRTEGCVCLIASERADRLA